jgi:hypothetical protein
MRIRSKIVRIRNTAIWAVAMKRLLGFHPCFFLVLLFLLLATTTTRFLGVVFKPSGGIILYWNEQL